MKLELTKFTHTDLLTMNSYVRYNVLLNGFYITAFIFDRTVEVYEIYEKAYKFIVENPWAVSHALAEHLTLPPFTGCKSILRTTINEINLDLDRKKQIIKKKLEEIEGDFK